MSDFLRVPYSVRDAAMGNVGLLSYLPVTLGHGGRTATAAGLVDSGSMVNVLPYPLGLALGAIWSDQPATMRLMGNLPARPLVVSATVGQYPPVQLAFAWTQAEDAPLILGQMNFLAEFDVCFCRSERAFEVQPRR